MDEIYKTIKLLQIENENIKNRVRILEEDLYSRNEFSLKKAQLQKFFEYTSEEQIDSTDSE